VPASPPHQPSHAVGLVPGSASLPYFAALRLRKSKTSHKNHRGARSSSYRLRRPPHPSREKPLTRFFGFWVLDFGYWLLGFGYWVLDIGLFTIKINFITNISIIICSYYDRCEFPSFGGVPAGWGGFLTNVRR
jgi:hypothetical protein